MPRITKRGEELARKLQPFFEANLSNHAWSWLDVAATLSLIARHARTHHRLAEAACNGYPDDDAVARVEFRIATLARTLPLGDQITVWFQGDPRGATVKLAMPPEWRHLHDCFGGEVVCV